MNPGDIIEMTLKYRYNGNEFRNVFHYTWDFISPPVTLLEATQEFFEAMCTVLQAVVVGGTTVYGASALNITDDISVADYAPASPYVTSGRTGEASSMFVALGITLLRTDRSTKQGAKRFGPLSESDVTAGVISSGLLTSAETAVAVLTDPILVVGLGGSGNLTPVIYGEALPERPSKRGGMLPPRPASANPIVGAVVNTQATSQVSRKPGRGV